MSRIAVATCDPIGSRMAGPAIRAWHIAEALATTHDVRLVSLAEVSRTHPSFDVRVAGADELVDLERWMDLLVFQGGLIRIHPFLRETPKPMVVDIYDPFHLENLEQTRGQPQRDRASTIAHLTGVLNEQLERGDFFICASERQRHFWLGSLAALGRLTPSAYDEDPTLRSLIDVVPFGLPSSPPARSLRPVLRGAVPGVGIDDKVILWGGGVYNWLDPLTLLRAMEPLRRRLPTARLVFLGMQHPNPAIPAQAMAEEARVLADALGLTGTHVIFNEDWVDYDERGAWLLEADVGVTTHLDHVETAYSFRTRVLDYLWAGLPIVTTTGDGFADLVDSEGLGITVPPDDPEALSDALERVLTDAGFAATCRENAGRVAKQFTWNRALAPLVTWINNRFRS